MRSLQKKAYIVIGLGFGDEGKGLATDFLCLQHPDPLVIRFNGGQQAGHTVVTSQGKRHVFSHFGAGTLRGVPTYWSQYCTFSPSSLLKEFQALVAMDVHPELLVDRLCAVTTHYDVLYNRLLETARGTSRHGSCGMGFGATVERHQLSPVRLYAQDLAFPLVCSLKLKSIREYYRQKLHGQPGINFEEFDHAAADQQFLKVLDTIQDLVQNGNIRLVHTTDVLAEKNPWQTFIFEGAQGVLLDMDFGFFPHVTRSHTCSRNAIALISHYLQSQLTDTEIVYVSRVYQTRHGQGPMTHEEVVLELQHTEQETNQYNEFQGTFRVSPLDLDLLRYAINCDNTYAHNLNKNLILTCADQLKEPLMPFFEKNVLKKMLYTEIPDKLNIPVAKTFFSQSNCAEHIESDASIYT